MQFLPYHPDFDHLALNVFEAAKLEVHERATGGQPDSAVLERAVEDEIAQAVQRPAVRRLLLRAPRIENLDALGGNRLETLILTDAPRIASLAPLSDCLNLRTLIVEDCPRLLDIQALSALADLKTLRLSGPALGGGWKKIGLAPLSGLTRLRHLDLAGIRTPDESLTIVAALPNLEVFDPDGGWPARELARVAAAHPHLKGTFLKPLVASAHFGNTGFFDVDPSKYPPEAITYMVSGKRGATDLRPGRDDARLARAQERWNAWILESRDRRE